MWPYVAGILVGAVVLSTVHTYLERKINVKEKPEAGKAGDCPRDTRARTHAAQSCVFVQSGLWSNTMQIPACARLAAVCRRRATQAACRLGAPRPDRLARTALEGGGAEDRNQGQEVDIHTSTADVEYASHSGGPPRICAAAPNAGAVRRGSANVRPLRWRPGRAAASRAAARSLRSTPPPICDRQRATCWWRFVPSPGSSPQRCAG